MYMKTLTIEKIFQAGIVGGGGAGFPSWKKLNAKVEWLLINGAECEPLLKSDQYIMRTFSERLIEAACAVAQMTEAEHTVIALKRTYKKEIQELSRAIEAAGASIEIFPLRPVYPAGDETIIVREVSGRTVPPGGIPLDVGCVVTNVSTLLALSDSLEEKPSITRYVTVAGATVQPGVFLVPVGTYVTDLLNWIGC